MPRRKLNPSDFYDKSLKWKSGVEEKIELQRSGVREVTQRECTFRPLLESSRDFKAVREIGSL